MKRPKANAENERRLDPRKLVRVDDDAQRLHTSVVHIGGEDGVGATATADDDRQLTVDLLKLGARVLRPEAASPQEEARHRLATEDWSRRRALDLAAAIRPERHVLGQHAGERGHITRLRRL